MRTHLFYQLRQVVLTALAFGLALTPLSAVFAQPASTVMPVASTVAPASMNAPKLFLFRTLPTEKKLRALYGQALKNTKKLEMKFNALINGLPDERQASAHVSAEKYLTEVRAALVSMSTALEGNNVSAAIESYHAWRAEWDKRKSLIRYLAQLLEEDGDVTGEVDVTQEDSSKLTAEAKNLIQYGSEIKAELESALSKVKEAGVLSESDYSAIVGYVRDFSEQWNIAADKMQNGLNSGDLATVKANIGVGNELVKRGKELLTRLYNLIGQQRPTVGQTGPTPTSTAAVPPSSNTFLPSGWMQVGVTANCNNESNCGTAATPLFNIYINRYKIIPVSNHQYEAYLVETKQTGAGGQPALFALQPRELSVFAAYRQIANAKAATKRTFGVSPFRVFDSENAGPVLCQTRLTDTENALINTGTGSPQCVVGLGLPLQDNKQYDDYMWMVPVLPPVTPVLKEVKNSDTPASTGTPSSANVAPPATAPTNTSPTTTTAPTSTTAAPTSNTNSAFTKERVEPMVNAAIAAYNKVDGVLQNLVSGLPAAYLEAGKKSYEQWRQEASARCDSAKAAFAEGNYEKAYGQAKACNAHAAVGENLVQRLGKLAEQSKPVSPVNSVTAPVVSTGTKTTGEQAK